jgi:ATP-dependent RNA helicase DDX27
VQSFPGMKQPEPKEKIKRGKYDGLSRQAKRRKMAIEADEQEGTTKATSAAIRAIKKSGRPTKITEPMARPIDKKKDAKADRKRKSKARPVGRPRGSAFDDDKKGGHEGMRAKPVKVNLLKKGKTGAKGGKGKGKR